MLKRTFVMLTRNFVNSFNKTFLQFDIHCLHINIFCSYGVE